MPGCRPLEIDDDALDSADDPVDVYRAAYRSWLDAREFDGPNRFTALDVIRWILAEVQTAECATFGDLLEFQFYAERFDECRQPELTDAVLARNPLPDFGALPEPVRAELSALVDLDGDEWWPSSYAGRKALADRARAVLAKV